MELETRDLGLRTEDRFWIKIDWVRTNEVEPRIPRTMPLIRLASLKDLDAVATLEQNWTLEDAIVGFQANGVQGFVNHVTEVDKSIWVAEAQNDVVGYVTASIHRSSQLAVVPIDEWYIEIDDLYVSPEFRSASLGSRMVETVLDFARAQNIKYASVFSASSRVADIMRFYQNQRFEPWGIQFYRRL